MPQTITTYAQAWVPAIFTVLSVVLIAVGGWKAVKPGGSVAAALGFLIGGAIVLALAGSIDWLVDKASTDIGNSGRVVTPGGPVGD